MPRIYQTENAGVTYQGSTQSQRYTNRQAPDDRQKLKDYKNEIIEQGRTKLRDLERRQAATNLVLSESQKITMAQLKREGKLEEYDLKRKQLADKGIFDLEQKTDELELQGQNKYLENTLKMESKYNEDSLKLKNNYNALQRKNELLGLQQTQKVQNAGIATFDTAVRGLFSMSQTYIQETEKIRKLEEADRLQTQLVDAVFGLENEPPSTSSTDASVDAADTVATEDAIQTATDDPDIQSQLRNETSQSTLDQQVQRSNVFEAAQDFPIFYENWVNDTSVIYTRANGTEFTVATAESRADLQQISLAARRAFYTAAINSDMPKDQIAEALIPVVRAVDSNWVDNASAAILEGRNADRVQSATVSIQEQLDAGTVDIQVIFDTGFAELYGSGAYIGKKGAATEATVKTILQWAIRNNRDDVIEALADVEKVKGNKGTRLGNQYRALFEEAREGVLEEEISDISRDQRLATAQVLDLNRTRELALANAETPEEERQINLQFADQLDQQKTPEATRAAAELRANPNYSPFTAMEMQEQARNGKIWSNEELASFVANGEINAKEAKELGWNPEGTTSANSDIQDRAEEFDSEMKAQGKAAVLAAIRATPIGNDAEAARLLMESQGESAISNMERDLMDATIRYMRANPTASDRDISDFIRREGAEMAKNITFEQAAPGPDAENPDLGATYTIIDRNGQRAPINDLTPTIRMPGNPNDARSIDYRNYTPDELRGAELLPQVRTQLILNEREMRIATLSIQQGQPIPQAIQDKAAALNTNAETLLRAQFGLYGRDYPEAIDSAGGSEYLTPGSFDQSQYDTGMIIGGVNLDQARNTIVSKESTNNFSAVNNYDPSNPTLGFAQVQTSNVKSWSIAALGYRISPREFLRSPELQMKIINHRLETYFRQELAKGYSGNMLLRRVASLWYSGNPDLYNSTRPESGGYPSIQAYTLDIIQRYQA